MSLSASAISVPALANSNPYNPPVQYVYPSGNQTPPQVIYVPVQVNQGDVDGLNQNQVHFHLDNGNHNGQNKDNDRGNSDNRNRGNSDNGNRGRGNDR